MIAEAEKDLLLNTLPGMAYRCSVEPPWPMEYVSPGIALLCSYTVEDLMKDRVRWGEIIHEADLPLVEKGVAEAVARRGQFTLSYRIQDPKRGTRWVLERGEGVYAAPGEAKALVGFIADVTEQRAAQEESEKLLAELVQLSGINAVGSMAATLAHELIQPLAAAANYLTGAQHAIASLTGEERPAAEQGVGEAKQQIHRVGEIVRRTRRMISKQPGTRADVSLKNLVAHAAKALAAGGACPNLLVRTRVRARADAVRVDPVQIEQVLLNLLRNAAQASAPDKPAEVTVSARIVGSTVQVRVRDRGKGLSGLTSSVRVRDHGKGLSGLTSSALFSGSGHSSTGGLGLGLSISNAIIRAHGGRIWATGNSGPGASFYFTLPMARGG